MLGRLLVLGDGDFAYSAREAAAKMWMVTATTIDTEVELQNRYPTTFGRHRDAVARHGGRCAYEVDATQLDTPRYKKLWNTFDRVLWHNPYAAAASSGTHQELQAARAHRKLVSSVRTSDALEK